MWQGLRSIAGDRGGSRDRITDSHVTLDELNEFYSRFDALGTELLEKQAAQTTFPWQPLETISIMLADAICRHIQPVPLTIHT